MMKPSIVFFCAVSLAWGVRAETLRVQVQNGQIRETPSFLGHVVATVPYGQAVEASEAQGGWRQVRTTDGKAGWLHASALTAKRLQAQGGGAAVGTGASGDEMALAGKGFNADVEARFKSEHAGIDFTWVDKMSKMNASAEQIARFAQAGGLKRNGGAQ